MTTFATVFLNVVAAVIALAIAFPLVIFFDISINGVFNPEYGKLSSSFLNGEVAMLASAVSFLALLILPMYVHYIVSKKFFI